MPDEKDIKAMALHLKNPEVLALAEELAQLSGTSKTEAIRQALLEQKRRLLLGRSRNPSAHEKAGRSTPGLLP